MGMSLHQELPPIDEVYWITDSTRTGSSLWTLLGWIVFTSCVCSVNNATQPRSQRAAGPCTMQCLNFKDVFLGCAQVHGRERAWRHLFCPWSHVQTWRYSQASNGSLSWGLRKAATTGPRQNAGWQFNSIYLGLRLPEHSNRAHNRLSFLLTGVLKTLMQSSVPSGIDLK